MKNILSAIILALPLMVLQGCGKHEEVYFDTPFVTISDKSKLTTSMTIDKDGNNILTELCVSVNVSREKFTEAISIEYELIVGDGLEEGVDFKIQASTKSPLTFEPGIYDLPVRILWYKTDTFDESKDNSLVLRLASSSLPDMVLGYPGPNEVRRSFRFEKIKP
ncbi:MAG: hypothetical protein ACI399_08060 [Candidatus Cryptobacteroides sp.]